MNESTEYLYERLIVPVSEAITVLNILLNCVLVEIQMCCLTYERTYVLT